MTYLQTLHPGRSSIQYKFFGPLVVAASFLAAYFPTVKSLIEGPWQTEQEGHGPLIIAAALWLAWRSYQRFQASAIMRSPPAPVAGWITLLLGLALMFLARTQGVLTVEAFSIIPVISGCLLLAGGWSTLRTFAFPIGFLLFAVPLPDWLIDAATVPLKVLISDAVTRSLYAAE